MTASVRIARLFLLLAVFAPGMAPAADDIETVVVTGRRVATSAEQLPAAVSRIDSEQIATAAPLHPHEIAWQVPGAWISRGSGQEQLTAIRSPVLTGAGSCGAFLFLEDGIPVRPVGFCNVNQLFEVNTEQAAAIEIARGPVSAVWGANALHGAINVINDQARDTGARLTVGADDYIGLNTRVRFARFGQALVHLAHDGGFRDDAGYDQGKVNLYLGDPRRTRLLFSASELQQETAGFILGQDSFRDDDLREANLNPEAYRDASAQRLALKHQAGEWQLTAFARHSRMAFLQHFLPGKPLERNDQRSAGLQAVREASLGPWSVVGGIDLELANGNLSQVQAGVTTGSPFLVATRPQGQHYRYEVDSYSGGAWISLSRQLGAATSLEAAIRADATGYDYDNQLAAGNLRDDGSACGFGGCLYNRPADRSDRFNTVSPRLATIYRVTPRLSWRNSVARGFRPPQTSELYRLQRGQNSADIDNESTTSVESGLVFRDAALNAELSAYTMRKDDVILRDADGFTINDGRTTHQGIELDADWRFDTRWSLHLTWTRALHRYDFDRDAALGETIRRGSRVDTAPEHIGSLRLGFSPTPAFNTQLEWLHMGSYFTNAANSQRYPGHELVNFRSYYEFGDWQLGLRISNLTDRRYAERADFAFGNARYFPGRERALFLSLDWRDKQ
ncbi:MAG: TonB-dependent receptor [Gammaproteobacteria bacterium]|nr:TonB-dependent receptor [Gammaproteobacteria bacterium]